MGLLGAATRFVPKDRVQLLVRDLEDSERDLLVYFSGYYMHKKMPGHTRISRT
jgi:hypothetical protein